MITLENVHKAMNNPQVQKIVGMLYQEWMWQELDGLEDDPVALRRWTTALFKRLGYTPVTEEQLLAAETLFQSRTETGQAWSQ